MTSDYPLDLADVARRTALGVDAFFQGVERYFRSGGCWANVENFVAGKSHFEILMPVPNDAKFTRQFIAAISGAAGVHRMWYRQSERVAFNFHPDLVTELRDSTMKKMPGDVFRRLLHTSPLVLFAQPIPATTPNGEPAQLHGFFVYGMTGMHGDPDRALCYTDDPAMQALGIMTIIEPDDQPGDFQFDRLAVPLLEKFTVAEAVNATMKDAVGQFPHNDDAWATQLADRSHYVLTIALTVLLYVCDDEADHVYVPLPKQSRPSKGKGRKAKTARRERPTRFVRSGWVDGPPLAESRRNRKRRRPAATGTGWEHDFHRRRGCFRPYWTGAGRTVEKVKWVKPHYVREDKARGSHGRIIPVRLGARSRRLRLKFRAARPGHNTASPKEARP